MENNIYIVCTFCSEVLSEKESKYPYHTKCMENYYSDLSVNDWKKLMEKTSKIENEKELNNTWNCKICKDGNLLNSYCLIYEKYPESIPDNFIKYQIQNKLTNDNKSVFEGFLCCKNPNCKYHKNNIDRKFWGLIYAK